MRKRGEGSIARIGRGVYKVRISTGVIGGKRGRHEEIVHGTHEDSLKFATYLGSFRRRSISSLAMAHRLMATDEIRTSAPS